MATQIFVAGPTTIKIGASVLGLTDNDNLPAIQFTDFNHEVKVVDRGQAPAEVVMQGTVARISVALVKWDAAILATALSAQRGAATASDPGFRLVDQGGTFELKIEGANGSYEFPVAYFQPDGVQDSQWGNRERVLTLAFMAIPNASNVLYTLA
jgi:hypothetical protein